MFRINVKEEILIFEMNTIRWVITRPRGLNLGPLPALTSFIQCRYTLYVPFYLVVPFFANTKMNQKLP